MTIIDKIKKEVDFRILAINGKYVSITFNNKKCNETISKKELKRLQKKFTWITDF